jgi:dCTP diphosphatase
MTDDSTRVAELRKVMADFVAARDWERYHDAKNLSMAIAIEAAELMEHFQWVRSEELPELLRDEARRAKVVDEVADIACYLFSLVNALGIDLSTAMTAKMAKNVVKYPVEQFRGHYFKPGE